MNSPKIELILAVSGWHWEEIKDSNPRILVVGFGHFGTNGLNAADGSFVRARRRVIKVANPQPRFREPMTTWLQAGNEG